ncbi:hypothetical protein [Saccharopolyspora karakumensis]|uniref:hypothetical protein n=1 Tax=Saccharopolyspora karakumensis TaxID=2530386 RepID=UPI0014047086|nr:hypothetical protein [Saccharopolyspora karakumensis]
MAVHNGFQPAIELIASGALDVERLVSATLPLADHAEAIEKFRAGEGHKIHLSPTAR